MSMRFVRGNSQTPKGHAIFFARSTSDSRTVYCTYCIVPPIPMSIAKYLPPMFAAQIPPEELGESGGNTPGMPIPPMLEQTKSLQYLEMLAERRDDDLCDIGPLPSQDEGYRMQMAAISSNEYSQLYTMYMASVQDSPFSNTTELGEPTPLDDLDAEELLLQTMSDRQKLTELGKLVGMARYGVEGHDTALLQDTKQRMQRIAGYLPEKYRGSELVNSALSSDAHSSRLAELYLSRAFKLLDEEYAEIPAIEREIRELQH